MENNKMDIILITIISLVFLIQLFFFWKLGQLIDEIDYLQDETEVLGFQYEELQKLIKQTLMEMS
tara:strand:+ start:355 stop:549 length:195 start_codon:yes stop_codon:yes gene_type:complete